VLVNVDDKVNQEGDDFHSGILTDQKGFPPKIKGNESPRPAPPYP
jgi:hypothetical protein